MFKQRCGAQGEEPAASLISLAALLPVSEMHLRRILAILVVIEVAYGQTATRSSRSGAQLFKVYCAKCHSMDGSRSLGPSLHQSMTSKRFDETEMRHIILDGKNTMPPFGRRLTAKELDKLIEYMKTL